MTDNGQITCQIKDEKLRKEYRETLENLPISESDFIRHSLRHMIACVQASGHMPPVKVEA